MRAAIRALTLIATIMLAAPAAGVAADATSAASAAVDATPVGSFMNVPEAVWTNINRFVFLVALDAGVYPGNPEYKRRSALVPSWPEVYEASQQWAQKTFPAVQQLAAELDKDDIGNNLGRMLEAANAIAAGHSDQRGAFDTAAKAIEGRIATLSGLTQTTMDQIAALARADQALRREAQQTHDLTFLDIDTKAEDVGNALRAATLAWGGLQSDVKDLRRVVDAAQKVDPDLYARMGVSRWKDIAADARGFLTDMKTQQRYLTGEDYYDACGVKEGQWYVLQGRVLKLDPGVNDPVCLTGGPRDRSNVYWTPCGLGPGGSSQQWRFQKIDRGWWRIYNKAQGDDLALDGGKGSGAFSDVSGNFSGQFWRVLTGGNGRCRLVNSFEGARYSLEAYVADKSGEHWGGEDRVTLQPTNKASIDQLWLWQ